MPRSALGPRTGLPSTSTLAVGWAGCCGERPAMRRSIVLLPQPLGPSTAMNSPLSGRSSTKKLTSRMAVNSLGRPSLKRLGDVAKLDDLRQLGGPGEVQDLADADFGGRGLRFRSRGRLPEG